MSAGCGPVRPLWAERRWHWPLQRSAGHWACRVFGALAPHLQGPLVEEALAAARSIGDQDQRSVALAALAPRLAATGRLHEALALVRKLGDHRLRSMALQQRLVPSPGREAEG